MSFVFFRPLRPREKDKEEKEGKNSLSLEKQKKLFLTEVNIVSKLKAGPYSFQRASESRYLLASRACAILHWVGPWRRRRRRR